MEKNICSRIRSHLLNHSGIIAKYLATRAKSYSERDWEADQIDALRDLLLMLRITPENKMAHLDLIKGMYTLKQYSLGKECLAFYHKLHPDPGNGSIKKTIDKFEDDSKQDDQQHYSEHYPEWTSENRRNFRDYLNRFTGHLNINTDIKEASWFGGEDQYIVAGSDCGSMFIWERETQRVLRVFKGDNYTINSVQPHPRRCLIASSGIDNVIRFWEPSATALKAVTERDDLEEAENRDITESRYELMKRNRRKRTPELVWEQLLNSVGLGIFHVDSTHEANDENADNEGGEEQSSAPQVIRCRQM